MKAIYITVGFSFILMGFVPLLIDLLHLEQKVTSHNNDVEKEMDIEKGNIKKKYSIEGVVKKKQEDYEQKIRKREHSYKVKVWIIRIVLFLLTIGFFVFGVVMFCKGLSLSEKEEENREVKPSITPEHEASITNPVATAEPKRTETLSVSPTIEPTAPGTLTPTTRMTPTGALTLTVKPTNTPTLTETTTNIPTATPVPTSTPTTPPAPTNTQTPTPLPVYSITYDLMGGYGAPPKQEKEYGKSVPISSISPIRDYYTFMGWAIKPGGEATYFAGMQYNKDDNLALYAVWVENSVSNWVPESDMPRDARLVEEKWTYIKTTFAESVEKCQYGVFWEGFDKNNNYYKQYNNMKKTTSDEDVVEITNERVFTYVLFHWCWNDSSRPNHNGIVRPWSEPSERNTFHAFLAPDWKETFVNIYDEDSAGYSYKYSGKLYWYEYLDLCRDSCWYYVIPIYEQTYIKKTKVVVEGETSVVVSGSEYSDVKRYVKYQKK